MATQILEPRAPRPIRLASSRSAHISIGNSNPSFLLQPPPPPSHPLEISISIPHLTPPLPRHRAHLQSLLNNSINLLNKNNTLNTPRRVLMRPFCVILHRNGGTGAVWEMLGRTETVEWDEGCNTNGGVRFLAKLKIGVESAFDRRKELRVEVWDRRIKSERIEDQVFIGVGGCFVEDIVGNVDWDTYFGIRDGKGKVVGKVQLAGDVIKNTETVSGPSHLDGTVHKVAIGVDMSSSIKSGMRCCYILSRELPNGMFTPVYKSEIIDKTRTRFTPIIKSVAVLAAGSEDKLLRIELYKVNAKGDRTLLGFAQANIMKLKRMKANGNLLWWPSKEGLHIGHVVLTHSRTVESDGKCIRSEFGFRAIK